MQIVEPRCSSYATDAQAREELGGCCGACPQMSRTSVATAGATFAVEAAAVVLDKIAVAGMVTGRTAVNSLVERIASSFCCSQTRSGWNSRSQVVAADWSRMKLAVRLRTGTGTVSEVSIRSILAVGQRWAVVVEAVGKSASRTGVPAAAWELAVEHMNRSGTVDREKDHQKKRTGNPSVECEEQYRSGVVHNSGQVLEQTVVGRALIDGWYCWLSAGEQ